MPGQDTPNSEAVAATAAAVAGSAGKARGSARGRGRRFSGRRRGRRGLPRIALNLTPMIDMVFLLLFFFLAVSRFGPQEGMLPTQLPIRTGAAAADIPQTPIRVRFMADPADPEQCLVSVDRFNETPLAIRSLAENLEKIKQVPGFHVRTPIHLLAGEEVRWDHVVNAYNAAMAAGYEKVFFADAP